MNFKTQCSTLANQFNTTFNIYEDLSKPEYNIGFNQSLIKEIEKTKSWVKILDNPEFPVVFLGTFSAGKSMIVNALIGEYILPEANDSCTAIPIFVRKGDQNQAKVYYLNEKFFPQKLNGLHKIPKEQLLIRLMRGIWYMNKLTLLTQNKIKDKNSYISELKPQNIVKNNIVKSNNDSPFEIKFSSYVNYEKYLNDLKKDLLYTKFTNNLKEFYVPDFIVFMRREIEIKIKNSHINLGNVKDEQGKKMKDQK